MVVVEGIFVSLKSFLCCFFFFPFLQERKKLKKFDQFVNFILLSQFFIQITFISILDILIDDDDDENDFCDEYRSYNHE